MPSSFHIISKLCCAFLICVEFFGVDEVRAESELLPHLSILGDPSTLNVSNGESANYIYKKESSLLTLTIGGEAGEKDGGKEVGQIDYETWEAPDFIQQNYPYYQAGYDDEDRPIWVAEFGKFKLRKILDQGERAKADMEFYINQASYRIHKSIRDRNKELGGDNVVSHVVFLVDFDGLELHRIAHLPTMTYLLKIARGHKHQVNEIAGATIIINASYPAEVLINAVRPLFGRTFENTMIYGTNKAKWIPHLRRLIPVQAIPPWYGGSSDFKPVAIYG